MTYKESPEIRRFHGRNGSAYDWESLAGFNERQQELRNQESERYWKRRNGHTSDVSAPPVPLSKAIKSGFYGGAAIAALASYLFFGTGQMTLILTWTLYGALGGATLIIALRILAFVIDVALKIIGWGIVVLVVFYLFEVI